VRTSTSCDKKECRRGPKWLHPWSWCLRGSRYRARGERFAPENRYGYGLW
jgi:hypothetical protein